MIAFALIANLSAQLKVNSSGKVGIGTEQTSDLLSIYNASLPSFRLEGVTTRLQIGVATTNGAFSSFAQYGDIVYRTYGKSYKKITPPTGIKDVRYTEDGIELPVKESEIIEFKEYGYLAQELKEVFPDLVTQDADGYYGVNYIGLIPVIVEAIKDQKSVIEKQQRQIEELQAAVFSGSFRSGSQTGEHTGIANVNTETAVLYQNAPNPFTELTVIRYSLPESAKNAEIYIFNMQGSVIKKILATRSGMVEIKGSDLQAGMYLYSLIVDGREVDTKRMILTK